MRKRVRLSTSENVRAAALGIERHETFGNVFGVKCRLEKAAEPLSNLENAARGLPVYCSR
jgi:hypothetical protein